MSLSRWNPQQIAYAHDIVNDIAEDIDNDDSKSDLRDSLAIYADLLMETRDELELMKTRCMTLELMWATRARDERDREWLKEATPPFRSFESPTEAWDYCKDYPRSPKTVTIPDYQWQSCCALHLVKESINEGEIGFAYELLKIVYDNS